MLRDTDDFMKTIVSSDVIYFIALNNANIEWKIRRN